MNLSTEQLVYELRTLLLDIEIKDVRLRRHRAANGKMRPYLTVVFALAGNFVAAYGLSPESPNQQSISALLFRAMAQPGDGSIPKEIRLDRSAAPCAPHLQDACADLGISLRPLTDEHPATGEGERFLETLQSRIREALPAYMGPMAGNEMVHPTLGELEHILKDCLAEYHCNANSGERQSPLAMLGFPGAADPRRLVRLLGEGARRAVTSKGISYYARRYWHDELASLPPRTEVIIYATPSLAIPKSVEVFHQGTWVCTALVYRG